MRKRLRIELLKHSFAQRATAGTDLDDDRIG